jgi:hypothetical protein
MHHYGEVRGITPDWKESKMRKYILLVVFLAFLTTGCTAISKWTQAQANCASDPACLEEAQRYAKVGEAVASPWGPIAVGASGSCILFVALGILGMRKKSDGK